MPAKWIIRSGTKSFRFKDAAGTTITDQTTLAYLKSLGIPPAWENVRIAPGQRSKILATGTDGAGRTQYIYNPAFRARQERSKYERIVRFAKVLPIMRRTVARDLKRPHLDYRKVMATILSIMDRTYMRIGNDSYARSNQSYGLTTLRSRHTSVSGDTVIFDFIGKSGQHHIQKITERSLARIVRQLDGLPGYELFKYYNGDGTLVDVKSQDVNAYIKDIMGEEFSAKDFRTWAGTLLASSELAAATETQGDVPGSDKQAMAIRKRAVTACVRKVARMLGNTPAIARSSYIDPRIIQKFMDGEPIGTTKHVKNLRYMSPEEQYVLQILQN